MKVDLIEMINDYNEYIQTVSEGSLKLSMLLRNKEIDSSLTSILAFSEGITWLLHTNEEFEKNFIVTGIEKDKLVVILNEINKALEKEDFYLVADIFEYEVNEYFTSLKSIKLEA